VLSVGVYGENEKKRKKFTRTVAKARRLAGGSEEGLEATPRTVNPIAHDLRKKKSRLYLQGRHWGDDGGFFGTGQEGKRTEEANEVNSIC